MRKSAAIGLPLLFALLVVIWLYSPAPVSDELSIPTDNEAIERGRYLVIAGGCLSCHRSDENSQEMSGGYAMETEFGRFTAANITSDNETGVGSWSGADFVAALKYGRSPDGSFYYPAFPYRAYAGLSDEEVLDIAAYLQSLPAVVNQIAEPDTPWWLHRPLVAGWNKLADFTQAELESPSDPLQARGAHLARNLGHCGECHTPRGSFGIPDTSREFAGATIGEEVIEAIDAEALAEWTPQDFELLLFLGMKPDGEFVGGDMNVVIEHNTSQLTEEDQSALAAFFLRDQGS